MMAQQGGTIPQFHITLPDGGGKEEDRELTGCQELTKFTAGMKCLLGSQGVEGWFLVFNLHGSCTPHHSSCTDAADQP